MWETEFKLLKRELSRREQAAPRTAVIERESDGRQ
jgi:hypothetical protein